MLRQVLKSARQVLGNIFYAPASVQKCFLSSGKCSKIFLMLRQVFKNIFYASASAQIRSASAQKYV